MGRHLPGETSLSTQYPILYKIVSSKNVTASQILSQNPLNISFRRLLSADKWDAWLHLVERLMGVTLTDEKDHFQWKLTSSGLYSVKSMYEHFMNGHTRFLQKYI